MAREAGDGRCIPYSPCTHRGAYALYAQRDPRETTKAARTAFQARFLDEVDPERVLSKQERERRADAARRLFHAACPQTVAGSGEGDPSAQGIVDRSVGNCLKPVPQAEALVRRTRPLVGGAGRITRNHLPAFPAVNPHEVAFVSTFHKPAMGARVSELVCV